MPLDKPDPLGEIVTLDAESITITETESYNWVLEIELSGGGTLRHETDAPYELCQQLIAKGVECLDSE